MLRTKTTILSAAMAGMFGLAADVSSVQAGGGCGCEAAPTVMYAPRCHHHHGRHYPPAGILVQSAPVMAAPMMMAPAYAAAVAAPQFALAPVQQAPAPQYALVQVTSQSPQIAPQSALSCQAEENLKAAVLRALGNNGSNAALGAPNSPQAALGSASEQKLDRLEERVGEIESTISEIRDLITDQNKAILEMRKK